MARYALPEDVSVQVPPNLSPAKRLLDCGVDDLGGVSPVTDDHINPEYEWPAIEELHDIADLAGVPLEERLPVYDRYVPDDELDGRCAAAAGPDDRWLSEAVLRRLRSDGEAGRRYQSVLADDTEN